ncbi:anti-sigma regulatory factor serine/threonine protein kinase [Clostridium aceticum]|uniref:Anti-sigma regulatory factor serine/threonine protein kinase n=1 Tax=Clostridium aceticum TaxID=84022 RepID=A0A0D8IDB7_9CLOT|nr:ATP-binding protein [Clostridium aceticum]AKL95077.1 anti-sigma regulatory factor serine/threonine protein kinase [Clostridium aceticum]KJF27962.1 anti-sigma regulatory factor [Clostridium aceticum]
MSIIKLYYLVEKDDFKRAGQASSSIKKVLRQLGIEPKTLRKIAIATYEAEMNLIIHSEGGFIEVNISPEKVEVLVEDRGPGIADIELAMKEGYSTASDQVRKLGFGAGMGLPNIKRCCDEFKIESSLGEYTRLQIVIHNRFEDQ